MHKKFGPDTALGRRRTRFEAPPEIEVDLAEALIEREPVTVLVSQKGWIRALKGHVADLSAVAFKGDDALQDLVLRRDDVENCWCSRATARSSRWRRPNCRAGAAQGEPIRLMADLDESADIVAVWLYGAGEKMLVATSDGRGFIVGQDEMLSATRKGRAVLNVDAPARARLATPADGDHVAVIGENRKLLVFPLAQTPEMARGKGVRLQRYKDGGLADARVFKLAEG